MKSIMINSKYHILLDYSELTYEKLQLYSNIAVRWIDGNIYPIARTKDLPGIYFGDNMFGEFTHVPFNVGLMVDLPTNKQNLDITDIIRESESARDVIFEQISTTDVDNIFSPAITGNEAVEMKMLKDAIIAKKIDINKYEARFKGKFQNDKRLLSKDTISLDKLKGIAEALDLEISMTIRDRKDSVPNPMNTEFTGVITTDEEEE